MTKGINIRNMFKSPWMLPGEHFASYRTRIATTYTTNAWHNNQITETPPHSSIDSKLTLPLSLMVLQVALNKLKHIFGSEWSLLQVVLSTGSLIISCIVHQFSWVWVVLGKRCLGYILSRCDCGNYTCFIFTMNKTILFLSQQIQYFSPHFG